ncbi:MAG: response regulator transcription factor [Kiloniellaceae bacterium]
MKIVLADDHALFRAGLHSALAEAFGSDTEILEAANFSEWIAVLEPAGHLDLILCDLRMPGMDPADGVGYLAGLRPDTPLVMISASEEPADARRSIQQGAKGYIPKSDSLAVLSRALDLVLAGGIYAPAAVLMATPEKTAEAVDRSQDPSLEQGDAEEAPPALDPQLLSSRQMMIFKRLANGMPNKMIARELGIAEGTVKAQLRTVFRKLGVQNRTQAALYAAQVLAKDQGPCAKAKSAGGTARSAEESARASGEARSPRPRVHGKFKVFDFPS